MFEYTLEIHFACDFICHLLLLCSYNFVEYLAQFFVKYLFRCFNARPTSSLSDACSSRLRASGFVELYH